MVEQHVKRNVDKLRVENLSTTLTLFPSGTHVLLSVHRQLSKTRRQMLLSSKVKKNSGRFPSSGARS